MNCSYCDERSGYILMANKLWCEECWADAQNKFSKNYDELMERVYEIKGMKEAGWELTQKGNYYYKDEDHDNVINLSY